MAGMCVTAVVTQIEAVTQELAHQDYGQTPPSGGR